MSGILVAGTSSDAGKSLVVTALCRAAWRRGIDVVPYKAQNLSLIHISEPTRRLMASRMPSSA